MHLLNFINTALFKDKGKILIKSWIPKTILLIKAPFTKTTKRETLKKKLLVKSLVFYAF